jgi:hypothetical protein
VNKGSTKTEVLKKTRKYLSASEKHGTNAKSIKFDPFWLNDNYIIFNIDSKNFQVIGKSDETVKCPFDSSVYLKKEKG